MQYRPLGTTGFDISTLGFGSMRLPRTTINNKSVVDDDESIAMMHRAFEAGVNYIDTAFGYCESHSEVVVGKALKGWRDRVKLSTKLPMHEIKKVEDYRRILDEQLRKLDTDSIDFYHFHGLGQGSWDNCVKPFRLIEEMEKARSEGLIHHISFSFHDSPDVMKTLIDSGAFSSVLCQYNFLDQSNADSMAYAREKGVGVVVMGPVGGGRLSSPMEYVKEGLHEKMRTPELALRFVLSNPNVSCALSGMSSMRQLEENLATADNAARLSPEELERVKEAVVSRRELAKLYCTGCGYCMPCPHEVNIPVCFESMISHKVYGFTETAKDRYRSIGNDWAKGKRADACIQCGECEDKCPQNIPIREQLKAVNATLGPMIEGA